MEKKFVIAGIFLVLIIVSGLWLSRTGRPLNVLILTVHKLIAVAGVALLVITLYRLNQTAPLSPVEIGHERGHHFVVRCVDRYGRVTVHCQSLAGNCLRIHQIVPTLVILSTAANLYLLLGRKV